jgi:predicted DNA-binding transcriptional regulator AlpA
MKAHDSVERLGISALERRLGVDRSTIWRWYTATPPKFPAPEFIGERRVWRLDVIEAWEQAQLARTGEGRGGAKNLEAWLKLPPEEQKRRRDAKKAANLTGGAKP